CRRDRLESALRAGQRTGGREWPRHLYRTPARAVGEGQPGACCRLQCARHRRSLSRHAHAADAARGPAGLRLQSFSRLPWTAAAPHAKMAQPFRGRSNMHRRGLLVATVAALALSASAALAQEPMVFGVITPLSPPGETALGQQVKRGSEIAVDYLN